jgi:hypothetical protein
MRIALYVFLKFLLFIFFIEHSELGLAQSHSTPYVSFGIPRIANSVYPQIHNLPHKSGSFPELDLNQFEPFKTERPFSYRLPWQLTVGLETSTQKNNSVFIELSFSKLVRTDSTGFYRNNLDPRYYRFRLANELNQGYFKYYALGGQIGYNFHDQIGNLDYQLSIGFSAHRILKSRYHLNYYGTDGYLNFEEDDLTIQDKIWIIQPMTRASICLLKTSNMKICTFAQFSMNVQLKRLLGPLGHTFNVGIQIKNNAG